jgi:hypothetical protein
MESLMRNYVVALHGIEYYTVGVNVEERSFAWFYGTKYRAQHDAGWVPFSHTTQSTMYQTTVTAKCNDVYIYYNYITITVQRICIYIPHT